MNDQLDPQAMALTKAIRQVESGGNFKARSKDGSFGAYQFLKPTWDNTARKYGVNAEWEKATPQQQNEVAYKQIKEWKDKGHNVGEIASMWNAGAGRPQAYLQGLKGTNSSGVNYNVANYAKKVATLYQGYKGQSQPQVQQEPIEPVEPLPPTIPEQKQVIQTQGQPVSVRKDRTQPTLVGGILREVIKAPLKAALSVARPFVDPFGKKGGLSVNTKYLGNVGDYGTEIEKSSKNLSNKYKAGDISLGRAAIGGAGAGALQAMDAASVVPVGGVAGSAVKGTVQKALIPTLKTAAKESLIRGGAISTGYDVSNQLASGEKYKPLQTLAAGTIGTVADFGLSYGLPKALNKGKDILVKTPEQMSAGVDKDINKIYSNVTGDSGEIFKRKASFKRGIERLIQSDINVVSEKSPVGGKKIKNPLDPVKSSPNELINGLNNLSKQFAGKARANTVEATRKGIVLDTTATENFIRNAIDNKDIGRSAGEDLLTQIKRTEGRPVDLHDWVQNQVNMKFFKNNGDLASSKIATVADDAAKIMRKEIDTVVDRTGYAQAYGDNQELKKVMLSIAKSANKDFPFVDMATDAGIDAGISILTGNPAYMARTFATGLFKSVARNVKNQKGIGAFRNINKALKKTTITTKLPESGVKEGIFNYKSVGNPLPPVNTSKSTTATTDKIITSKTIPTLSNTTGNKASIPVMMTNKLRADLKNLGYTPDDIANLKPVEANKIVNEGLKPRNTIIDVKSNTTQLPKSKVKSSDLSTEAKKYKSAEELFKGIKEALKRNEYNIEELFPDRIGYKSTMNAEQMLKSAKDNLDRARNKTVREGGTGRPTKEYAESLKFWENSVKEKKDILNKLEENNSLYESTKDNYSNTKVLERLKELKRISEDDYNLLKTFLDYQLENGAITDMSQLTDIWNKANKK